MRIGIDARWIIKESSGIGQYTKNLIRYLAEIDSQNEYFIFFMEKEILNEIWNDLKLESRKNFIPILVKYSMFSIMNQIVLPVVIRKLKLNIFHSTNFMIPLFSRRVKIISTIHDLIPFLFPEYAPRSKKSKFYAIYKILMYCIVRRANHIFVDSEHSFQDLVGHFKKSKNKTSVLTFGIDPSFFYDSGECFEKKDEKQIPYILYVGRQDPYKNILFFIRVFRQVQMKINPIKLIIAGAEDKRYPEVKETIDRLGLDGKVILSGFLKQKELVQLYRRAKIFVLPSLYEGFGLPILEAFSAGVPVIASKVASIPEIAGDAAILINPKVEKEWIEETIEILENDEKAKRLQEKGYERLKNFSWEKTIRELLIKYQDILKT